MTILVQTQSVLVQSYIDSNHVRQLSKLQLRSKLICIHLQDDEDADPLIESEWDTQMNEITHNCHRLNTEAKRLRAAALEDIESDDSSRLQQSWITEAKGGSRPAWAQEAIEQVVEPAGHFFVSMCDLLGGWSTCCAGSAHCVVLPLMCVAFICLLFASRLWCCWSCGPLAKLL